MHPQQIIHACVLKGLFGWKGSVLDCGSMDINGNNRYLFGKQYTGLDIGPGKNVDIVGKTHEHDGLYDIVCSSEMLEHDKYWDKSLLNMAMSCRRVMFFTCATTGRAEHGTTRTSPHASPYTTDYYLNITEEMVRSIPGFVDRFVYCKFWVYGEDLVFIGIKPVFKFKPSLLRFIRTYSYWFYLIRMRDAKNAFIKYGYWFFVGLEWVGLACCTPFIWLAGAAEGGQEYFNELKRKQ